MLTQKIAISENGLSARNIRSFVQATGEYKCGIWIEHDGQRTNAKSVLGVLSAQIKANGFITLLADGEDEQEAIHSLSDLLSSF